MFIILATHHVPAKLSDARKLVARTLAENPGLMGVICYIKLASAISPDAPNSIHNPQFHKQNPAVLIIESNDLATAAAYQSQ